MDNALITDWVFPMMGGAVIVVIIYALEDILNTGLNYIINKKEKKKMDFGQAIKELKKGYSVTREGWNGKGQHIELASNISYKCPSGEVQNCNHDAIGNQAIAFVGTSGVQMGWLASQADMLAEDWVMFVGEDCVCAETEAYCTGEGEGRCCCESEPDCSAGEYLWKRTPDSSHARLRSMLSSLESKTRVLSIDKGPADANGTNLYKVRVAAGNNGRPNWIHYLSDATAAIGILSHYFKTEPNNVVIDIIDNDVPDDIHYITYCVYQGKADER